MPRRWGRRCPNPNPKPKPKPKPKPNPKPKPKPKPNPNPNQERTLKAEFDDGTVAPSLPSEHDTLRQERFGFGEMAQAYRESHRKLSLAAAEGAPHPLPHPLPHPVRRGCGIRRRGCGMCAGARRPAASTRSS